MEEEHKSIAVEADMNIMRKQEDLCPNNNNNNNITDDDCANIDNMQQQSKNETNELDAETKPEQQQQKQEEEDEEKETEIEVMYTTTTPQKTSDITVANEDCMPVTIKLEAELDNYTAIDFIRLCLHSSYPICLYCNHARRIAVNAKNLLLHLLEMHRFIGLFETIVEQQQQQDLESHIIVEKLKSFLPDMENEYMNSFSYNSLQLKDLTSEEMAAPLQYDERTYECFMCRFVTSTYKELYLHNRKMHSLAAVLCIMCRANFASFSEILCHICLGKPHQEHALDMTYRCSLCHTTNIPTTFRLMVHLRKKHNSCDVCLQYCYDQTCLSSHVLKHKERHLCYRCNITYRYKSDIENHLFWKHSIEGIKCNRCLRKRWRHFYHFCIPPVAFSCNNCNMGFTKAKYLNVHARLHANKLKYACKVENCEEKFVARRLFKNHIEKAHVGVELDAETAAMLATISTAQINTQSASVEEKHISDISVNAETAIKTQQKNDKDAENKDVNSMELNEKEIANVTNAESKTQDEIPINTGFKKHEYGLWKLKAPNLSESSDDDSSDTSSSDDESSNKTTAAAAATSTLLEKKTQEEDDLEKEQEHQKQLKVQESMNKVVENWQKFIAESNNSAKLDLNKVEQSAEIIDNYSGPPQLHVAISDHNYCRLTTPPKMQKKIKKSRKNSEQEQEQENQQQQPLQRRLPSGDDDDDDDDDADDSSCDKKAGNKKNNSNNNNRNSKNSYSDSDSSTNAKDISHQENLNQQTNNDNEQQITASMEQTEIEKAASDSGEIQFHESDLTTSESDSSEDFYDEHPEREAIIKLAQQQAKLATQMNATTNTYINGEQQQQEPQQQQQQQQQQPLLIQQKILQIQANANNLIKKMFENEKQNNNGYDLSYYQDIIHNTKMADSLTEIFLQQSTATTTSTITGLVAGEPNAYSNYGNKNGGSNSEADGSLKRSKRKRRPNKFYGYTSDDESINTSHGQKMMIGMRAFKPTSPPQLTWHKDDLPTTSKSIVHPNKPKMMKTNNNNIKKNNTNNNSNNKMPKNSLESAVSEFAEIFGVESRKPTFDIAAGGKVGNNKSSFYKRAAKRSNFKSRKVSSAEEKSHQLPPIPRLKIKKTQLILNTTATNNMQQSNTTEEQSSFTSSASSSDDDSLPMQMMKRRPQSNTTEEQSNTTEQQSSFASSASSSDDDSTPMKRRPNLNDTPVTIDNHNIPPTGFVTKSRFRNNTVFQNERYPVRPPAASRQGREGEPVFCYCRVPYDEESEMIPCDGDFCVIKWFHYESVNIVWSVGKWYCAECRPNYEDMYGHLKK